MYWTSHVVVIIFVHHARGSRKSPHRLSPCVLRILGICPCISVGKMGVCQGPHQPGHLLTITYMKLIIIPGKLAVVLHPAISEAEIISLTNYLCIMNIIVSVGQMLSLLPAWFRFLSCSFRMHISGIQKKKLDSIFILEYLSYKLTAKGKINYLRGNNKTNGLVGSQST